MSQVDKVQPKGKWEFDADVTDAFDDMLRRSIPQYDVMRQAVFDIGRRFVKHRTAIMDLGASRGEALAPFVSEYGGYNTYVAVEVSEPMLNVLRARFEPWIQNGLLAVMEHDLRQGVPDRLCSLILSVLTLQFTPINYRLGLMRECWERLQPGGAMVLVEKVMGSESSIDKVLVDLYHKSKAEHGYTEEDIQRKRLSLEGVLVPLTAAWNEEALRKAGFTQVECFWRWMNFAAWVAVK